MAEVKDVVAGYRRIRDKKNAMKEEHIKQLRPYNDRLESMESWLREKLGDSESIKTEDGTAYKSTTTHATVNDRQALLDFIIEGENFHLLDLKVNTKAAGEWLEETQLPIPGTNITRRVNIRVKK
jgi:hypothetical protein